MKRAFECSLVLGLLMMAIAGRPTAGGQLGVPTVAIYLGGELQSAIDSSVLQLERQLMSSGYFVELVTDAQPLTAGFGAPDAYVIPVQQSNILKAPAQKEIANYVAGGGLVLVLDAAKGNGTTFRNFVGQTLSLDGLWVLCEKSGTANQLRSSSGAGAPTLSDSALSFLPGGAIAGGADWPSQLEAGSLTSTSTECQHADTNATIRPLYTMSGDDMKVAAQAFGKVNTSGAVVWLGYDWKGGVQQQWGGLVNKLISDFSEGAYQPSSMGVSAQSFDAFGKVLADVANYAPKLSELGWIDSVPGIYPPSPSRTSSPSPSPIPSRNSSPSPSPSPSSSGNGKGSGNGNGNSNGNGNGGGSKGGKSRRLLGEPVVVQELVRRFMTAPAPAAAIPPQQPGNGDSDKGDNSNGNRIKVGNGNGKAPTKALNMSF